MWCSKSKKIKTFYPLSALTNFMKPVIDCLVFYNAFNNFSVISRHFPGMLPVLLVDLSRHKGVRHNANTATLSPKKGSHYYHFESILCDPTGDQSSEHPHLRQSKPNIESGAHTVCRALYSWLFNQTSSS